MHNMKVNVGSAMKQLYVRPWDQRICEARKKKFARITSMGCMKWEYLSMVWDPTKVVGGTQEYIVHRRPGRPLQRWTDKVAIE